MLAVLLVAVASAVRLAHAPRPPEPIEPMPSPTPIPAPTLRPDDPILSVDLYHVIVQFKVFPNVSDRCVQGGPYTFAPDPESSNRAVAEIPSHQPLILNAASAKFADMTGDGRAEVVLSVTCRVVSFAITTSGGIIGVFTLEANGGLRELAELPGRPITIQGDRIYVTAGDRVSEQGRLDVLRWDGVSFVRSDFDGYPRIGSLDLSAIAAGLDCVGLPARHELRLDFAADYRAADGDRIWSMTSVFNSWIETRGRPYYLVTLDCRRASEDYPYSLNLIVCEYAATGWKVDALVPTPVEEWTGLHVAGEGFEIVTATRNYGYEWNGREFVRVS